MAALDSAPLLTSGSVKGPGDLGNAAMQVFNSKRGRWIIASAVMMVVFVTVLYEAPRETLGAYSSSAGKHIGQVWRTPNRTLLQEYGLQSPMEASATAMDLSSGDLETIPNGLEKGNPSFHLIVPQTDADAGFCQFTLSAMILNYPPPTIATYQKKFAAGFHKEVDKIEAVYRTLRSKEINDDDLVLIVEGNEALFQLPADIMVQQYEALALEANERLKEQYGVDENGEQLFKQTVFFAAEKVCPKGQEEMPACLAIPKSPLPKTVYGEDASAKGTEPQLKRPRYLSAGSAMGPARDLIEIYQAAVQKKNEFGVSAQRKDVDGITAQGILSAVFGEQEWARTMTHDGEAEGTVWYDWAKTKFERPFKTENPYLSVKMTLDSALRYEYSIGIDYRSTLFTRYLNTLPDEIMPLSYNSPPGILKKNIHYEQTPTLPPILHKQRSPFDATDPTENLTLPEDNRIPFILELQNDPELDDLPPENENATSWAALPLLTNTYYPSVPALLTLYTPQSARPASSEKSTPPSEVIHANAALHQSAWHHPHARALLRRYLRTYPQGIMAFHNSAAGGDYHWDTRGGQGGVWIEKGVYKEWGVDICEGIEEAVFGDGKGRWLKEHEPEKEEDDKHKRRDFEEREVPDSRFGSSLEDYVKMRR